MRCPRWQAAGIRGGRGSVAGRFSDYYPAWVDNLADTADRSQLPAAELGYVLLPPAARAVRRHPLRRTLPRWRGWTGM